MAANLLVVEGDLLKSGETIIVHQCNCVSCVPKGLAAKIAKKWPAADPYANRHPVVSAHNCAVREDRATPGTIQCFTVLSEGITVIALFGQYAPGHPGIYFKEHGVPDTPTDRANYFVSALNNLSHMATMMHWTRIAMPWNIGCDMAGGDWVLYLSLITAWATRNEWLTVVLYKI